MKSEEFIREVDEELRRDEFAKLWRRYSALILAAAVIVVAGTAAKVGWDHWQERARAAEAIRFATAERALLAGNEAEAASQFAEFAAEGNTGFAELARLKEAEAKLAAKDQAGATAALDGLASSATDPILGDLAKLLSAEQRLATADPAELKETLGPLAAAGGPWSNQAREMLALVAIRSGALEEARGILGELSKDAGVQPSQQRRAAELLQAIGGAVPQASS